MQQIKFGRNSSVESKFEYDSREVYRQRLDRVAGFTVGNDTAADNGPADDMREYHDLYTAAYKYQKFYMGVTE